MGIVEALGPGAGEEVSAGDRVAIPWLGFACGHCRYCHSGRETRCEAQINTSYGVDGGYTEYVAAYERHIVRRAADIDRKPVQRGDGGLKSVRNQLISSLFR